MIGSDVASVIEPLSSIVKKAGKTPRHYKTPKDIVVDYLKTTKESSLIYGAVEFLSSPSQGTDKSPNGFWNYTIYGEYGSGNIDVRLNHNFSEELILPLQRAIDAEIISRSSNVSSLPPIVEDVIVSA